MAQHWAGGARIRAGGGLKSKQGAEPPLLTLTTGNRHNMDSAVN